MLSVGIVSFTHCLESQIRSGHRHQHPAPSSLWEAGPKPRLLPALLSSWPWVRFPQPPLLCCAESLRRTWVFVTPFSVACQSPLSTGILQARILEWASMPASRGSSQPRDRTQVSCFAGGFFTSGATREVPPRPPLQLRFDWFGRTAYITRRNVFHTSHWFLIKDCNSGIDRCLAQHVGKWHGTSMLSLGVSLSPNLYMFTNLEPLRTLCFWVVMEDSLHRHDWLHHWTLVIDSTPSPSPFLRGQTESSHHMVGFIGNQSLSICVFLKSLYYHSQHLGNSKTLGRSMPETGTKTKYMYFLL